MDRYVRYFPFFNSVKMPVTTAGISEPFYNAGFDLLVLEISGATTISAKVEGCVNNVNADGIQIPDNECVYTELMILDSEYEQVSAITSNGIYYISISGCSRVRVNATTLTGSTIIVGAIE